MALIYYSNSRFIRVFLVISRLSSTFFPVFLSLFFYSIYSMSILTSK
nr:MAG TPA: hypothetical protein [Caudoviricetes sp.]